MDSLDEVNKSPVLSVDSKPPDGLCTLYSKLPYLVLYNFTKCKMHTVKIKLVFSFKGKNVMNVIYIYTYMQYRGGLRHNPSHEVIAT